MNLLVDSCSRQGSRAANQDRLWTDLKRGIVAVADGMGGTADGGRAARNAILTLFLSSKEGPRRIPRLPPSPVSTDDAKAAMIYTLQHVNASVHQSMQGDSGTTLTVLQFVSRGPLAGWVVVGHVGDSRAYRLRQGVTELLTRDQGVGCVLREAIGIRPHLRDVQVTLRTARPGDRFLLASDGLWEHCGLDEVQQRGFVQSLLQEGKTAHAMAHKAIQCGTTDNTSVLLVDVLP